MIWQRIKQLERKTIYTFKTRNPNKILKVTDIKVIFDGRKSCVYANGKTGVLANYDTLKSKGKLTLGNRGTLYGQYIIISLIEAAVPNEVERKDDGIYLKPK